MAAAWNQVIGVEAANRALRMAQLAKHVAASLHRRHLARLTDAGACLAVTERVHAKVLDAPAAQRLGGDRRSSLPPAVTTGAFRRLARRPRPGRATAATGRAQRRPPSTPLTVRDDRLTTDWVRRYANPDGVPGSARPRRARLTDAIAAADRAAESTADDAARGGGTGSWPQPAPSDHLTRREPSSSCRSPTRWTSADAFVTSLLGGCSHRADRARVEATPRRRSPPPGTRRCCARSSRPTAEQRAGGRGRRRGDADACASTSRPSPGRARASLSSRDGLAERLAHGARRGPRHDVEAAVRRVRTGRERPAARLLERSRRWRGPQLAGIKAIAAKVVVDDPFVDVDAGRLDAPALGAARQAGPDGHRAGADHGATDLGHAAGCRAGCGRTGSTTCAIEPVMAHPRFALPDVRAARTATTASG